MPTYRCMVLTQWSHSPAFCEPEVFDDVKKEEQPCVAVLDLYGMPSTLEGLWQKPFISAGG